MSIGVLAGLSAGLLGVGGGAVTVPLLLWTFAAEGFDDGVATHVALATSLAAMIFTSLSSTWSHHRKEAVLWPVVIYLALGVMLGSLLGVLGAVHVTGSILQLAFAIFLGYVGLQMLVGFEAKANRSLPKTPGLLGMGGIIGCVSMYFGIGGGTLTVPLLSYCGTTTPKAVGSSAALGFPIALWGTIFYVLNGWQQPGLPVNTVGYVYWPAALGIIVTSALFANIGAAIAHRLNADQLRKAFSLLLIIIAVQMLIKNGI